MTTTAVTIRNQEFELHPLRALWWPKYSMLICADVHIGKADHFRKAGIPIPKPVNASNLWNLVVVLEYYKPSSIVFLGDLFHSRINSEWTDLTECLNQFPGIHPILIRGNHEIEANEAYIQLGFEVRESISMEGICLTHEPPEKRLEDYSISGHIHPAIRLRGNAQQQLRLPCFWFGASQGVLPAFGEFTGMHTIQPKKGDQVFVIAENQVIRIES